MTIAEGAGNPTRMLPDRAAKTWRRESVEHKYKSYRVYNRYWVLYYSLTYSFVK